MARAARSARTSVERRRQRTQRSSRRQPPAAPRRSERSEPPVLTRHAVVNMPARELRRRKPIRRRYDMRRGTLGAEVRLPSVPRISLSWRLASALLAALLGWALYQLWNAPEYRVQAAEVHGLILQNAQDVNAVLDVQDEPIYSLSPQALEEKLQIAFPEFAAAQVTVSLPNTVVVTVTERIPVLAWKQDERVQLVDADGIGFPVRQDGGALPPVQVLARSAPPPLTAPIDLEDGQPVAEILDLSARPFLAPEMVAGALALAAQAPSGSALVYDRQHGLGWQDENGWEVYFGDAQDMDMKLSVYAALVKRFQADSIYPVFISVEYVHAPYYRLEP